MAKQYRCNCCGHTFDEPNGVFEKLRCPSCDAVRYDADDEDNGVFEELESED